MSPDKFSPASPDTGEAAPPKAGHHAFGNGPTWLASAEGAVPVDSQPIPGQLDIFGGEAS